MQSSRKTPTTMRQAAIISASVAIVISVLAASQVGAQSSKSIQTTGRPAGQSSNNGGSYSSPVAPSPVAQFRQQQQSFRPTTTSSPVATATGSVQKRRPQQQQQTSYSQFANESPASETTEDPLADSEPALYGSVAGSPGVDFPAYTRIPKTSFTCEGKGFDFGFYADEEAACQVYHVCWSGRRESFLCGVGTVFNQAILACDYWHSVDCSKSSQFYGVNSELGKASAEPASGGGSQRIQPARSQATLPTQTAGGSSSSSLGGSSVGTNFGEPINQRRVGLAGQQPIVQQQQQYNTNDDANFNQPQQQQIQVPTYKTDRQPTQTATSQPLAAANFGATFAPQRVQQQPQQQQTSYDFQQQRIQANDSPVKTASQRPVAQAPIAVTTSSPPPPPPVKRPRFNMDFNQKVNSLIDSPVRPPIKGNTSPKPRPQQQQVAPQKTSYAQQAVNRAQQGGSPSLNQVGFAKKSSPRQEPRQPEQQQVQQQQQQQYDNELEEPQQQQQQTFDDSPVQTSTVQSSGSYNNGPVSGTRNNHQASSFQAPQQANVQTIRAGGSADGSSAITQQYDTMTPAAGAGQQQSDQSYDQSDESYNSNLNDDFRSAGAKAAASQNQNWYIMRSI